MTSKDPMIYDGVEESDLKESAQMLKTKAGQVNAVFACFGSAAQHAQFFEVALVEFLSAHNKLNKDQLDSTEFEAFNTKLQKKTLGALLKDFSKFVAIQDTNVISLLEKALEKRNFLMHHFFRERDGKLRLEKDRMELLSELLSIDSLLTEATTLTRAMRIALDEAIANLNSPPKEITSKTLFTAMVSIPNSKPSSA